MQEIEKGNKLRAELERKKAERGPIMAQAMKSQDDRAKREAAAAKAKVSCMYFVSRSKLIVRWQRRNWLGSARWRLRSTNRRLYILPRSPSLVPTISLPARMGERLSDLLPV